jgi:DNA helicase-2/ATP-dependent DNA helicase PcrA
MSQYHSWLRLIAEDEFQDKAFKKDNHTVVVAGPGSGKTRVLVMKIAKLLREDITPPQGIACLTYTRMMAKELELRLSSLGILDRPNVVMGTVHSFCLGHIVQPFAKLFELGLPQPIRIAPTTIWNEAFGQAREAVTGVGFDAKNSADRQFRYAVTRYHLEHADISFTDWTNQVYAQILQNHYDNLFDQGFVDFDIIVKNALKLVVEYNLIRQSLYAKFPWFAVDEYQDLGYPLFRIITEMVNNTAIKLFAIGDPDQAIFDFAGTDPKYLIELSKRPDMQPVIKLRYNYRSTKNVVSLSKAILSPYSDYEAVRSDANGTCRIYKCPQDIDQLRVISQIIQRFQQQGIDSNEIAVLHPWRDNGLIPISSTLEAHNIKYVMDKHPLYDRSMKLIQWMEDLCYWCLKGWRVNDDREKSLITFEDLLRIWNQIVNGERSNSEDDTNYRVKLTQVLWNLREEDRLLHEWLSIISEGLRLEAAFDEYQKIYPDEVSEFHQLYELTQPGNELENLRISKFGNVFPAVQLTTLHSSKGMQFDAVIIGGVEKIRLDDNGRRLFYVGVSRAKKEICLVYSETSSNWRSPVIPQYIQELNQRCSDWEYFKHFIL